MPKSTCKIGGCDKVVGSRGMCQPHYKRFMATGSPLRPCMGCGIDLTNKGLGAASYCDDGCKPKCRIEWCQKLVYAKHDVCRNHVNIIRRSGGAEPTWHFQAEKRCLVCGADDWPTNHLRRYCSKRCAALFYRSGGDVSREVPCVHCGQIIDLFKPSEFSGRKKRSDVGKCSSCVRPKNAVDVLFLSERDGDVCSICGEDVDISVEWPHAESPSVDHVIPYYAGGENTAENCALAHLVCNTRKNKYIDNPVA